jgi:hypothetical protein
MVLWFTSILFGSVVYLSYRAVAFYIAWRNYPQIQDSPIAILQKMKRYGENMDLPTIKLKGGSEVLFLLIAQTDSAYVCPPMLVIWKANSGSKLQIAVGDQLKRGGDPEIVAQILQDEWRKEKEKPGSSNIQEIRWNGTDPLHPSAHKIATGDIDPSFTGRDIILSQK